MKKPEPHNGLGVLLEKGGIYCKLKGNTPKEALNALITAIPSQQISSPENLLNAVLEREALMSTGIGKGIALPHPRNPLAAGPAEQFVALAFLETPVDWKALDGKPVDSLFLIVSASAKLHLESLSKITFFCQQDAFLDLLKRRAPSEEIISFITETEQNWA
jgi:PTS system nitrogen regulatory IIA component